MPNAVVLVRKTEKDLHIPFAKKASALLQEKGYQAQIFDVAATDNPDVIKFHLQQSAPEYLVTFDCAGFDLELMGGDLFLNSLCCPAAHVLLGEPSDYEEYLNKRMNFTMDFYCFNSAHVDYIKNNFKRVPYVYAMEQMQPVDSCMKRQLGIMIAGSVNQEKLKVANALKSFNVPFFACGSDWKTVPGVTVLFDRELKYGEQYDVFSQTGLVINVTDDSYDSQIVSYIIGMAGARQLQMNRFDNNKFVADLMAKLK